MKLIVTKEFDGSSVREFLRSGKGFSSRLFSSLKRDRKIMVGGKCVTARHILHIGEEIEIIFPQTESGVVPVAAKLDILFEDDFFIAVNKPAKVPCHPSAGHHGDTLANHVAAYFRERGIKTAIRIPARIDAGTTGIVIVAKNEYVAERFAAFSMAGKIEKTYICVCEGLTEKTGRINLPIGRAEESILKRKVSKDGKPAQTFYETVKQNEKGAFSVLKVKIVTGRTHQIRVHMAHVGHPLLGDWLYGRETPDIQRHLLHLQTVEFLHPVTHEKIVINAPVPQDLKLYLEDI